jgi:hypothetical protein
VPGGFGDCWSLGNSLENQQGNPPTSSDKEVMPMEQFLLTIAAGVVVALIVHWLGLNK